MSEAIPDNLDGIYSSIPRLPQHIVHTSDKIYYTAL